MQQQYQAIEEQQKQTENIPQPNEENANQYQQYQQYQQSEVNAEGNNYQGYQVNQPELVTLEQQISQEKTEVVENKDGEVTITTTQNEETKVVTNGEGQEGYYQNEQA